MDQDSLELAALGQKSSIEENDPSWNVRGRQMGSQSTAKLHANGTAGKSRQHSWLDAYGFAGAAVGGSTPGNPAGAAGVGALKNS